MSTAENFFTPHSDKQAELMRSDAKVTAAITGIQWAKTTSGAWWMKRRMHMHRDKNDNFIIAAPSYPILRQSTLPAFLKVMDGCGDMNIASMEFHMEGGGTAYFRTGTKPDSVVGITNVRAIWGDEAGLYSLYFWENIQGRASFKDAPIMLTSTPYAMNWFHKEILKPFKSGERPDIKVIQAKSCDNPFFPMKEYEHKRKTMDPRRFNAMYNGEFEKMHGLVYDCFDEEQNVCDAFQLPIGTRYYAGVDWGTTHPFVILVRAVTPTGEHVQVSEVYQSGWSITDFILVAKKLKQTWGIQTFFCDPSQPGYIMEFNANGLPAIGADNDIKRGIGLQYELIKRGKFRIFKNTSPHTIDEIESYHYQAPKDLGPDDKDKEAGPVDQENHTMDCLRYLTNHLYKLDDHKAPHVPGLEKKILSNVERVKQLKKGNAKAKRSESWS